MAKMGFGLMRLPLKDKDDIKSIDYDQVCDMVDEYMSRGNKYFDTAFGYHDGFSQDALRKAVVERYPRDSYIVANKLPIYQITKEEELIPSFEEELERTGLEYFDYYLMHNVSGFSEPGFIGVDSFKYANELLAEGKIKHLGMSSHADAEYIDNILSKHPELEFIQLQINYLDWESEVIQSKKCYEVARKYNLPIIIMEPLKGGFLTNIPEEAKKILNDYNDDSPVKWALRFCASLEGVEMILSGVNSLEQMKENLDVFDDITPLNNEEMEVLKKATEAIKSKITVPCTKCNYCVEFCPQSINIPKIFDIYNSEMIEQADGYTAFGNAYCNYIRVEGNGFASDCIECGACIKQCPQHIDIPSFLVDVKNRFETELYGFKQE
ncbi:MAG: aldo/keto reductase [Methanosphaera sp.]|nr:aldo/keto reductase [Methanosphaera sp.]